MSFLGKISSKSSIESFGIKNSNNQYCNLSSDELVNESLSRNMGSLSNTGALCIRTGEFTGRSPEDKFTVDNEITHDSVDWNKFCLLYTSDAADERSSVDLGGRRIIKKKTE